MEEEKNKCESCNGLKMVVLKDLLNDRIYHLCMNCLFKLVNTSLNKEEFNNLIKNGHDNKEFFLHGDFYDDGEALQRKKE